MGILVTAEAVQKIDINGSPMKLGEVKMTVRENLSNTLGVSTFIFKARKQAHSELCNCFRNAEDEQKDK
ncbi:MAG: hypothetical protein V3U88_06180 [Methylococcales bacterium]